MPTQDDLMSFLASASRHSPVNQERLSQSIREEAQQSVQEAVEEQPAQRQEEPEHTEERGVNEEVMRYAMMLCSSTHADSECASEAAKKYVRLGASPRAGQALISAAKVKALMNGRFNVSYNDINELAYPVLRHRMKLTFEAIAERVSADEIVKMIIDELMVKCKLAAPSEKAGEDETNTDKKRGLFGRK